MFKKILVPLDGSSLAECVLPYAKQEAAQHDAELIFIQVVKPLESVLNVLASTDPSGLPADVEALESIHDSEVSTARDYLNGIAGQASKEGLRTKVEVLTGAPAEKLVDYAKESEVDLIAMATHGRGGFARWYLGSVADKVLHAATKPVLLIRASAS